MADLRDLIKDEALDDPSLVSGHLAQLIELMVVRFERLVEVGQFDSALPRLTELPMLYSPHAGKGPTLFQTRMQLFWGGLADNGDEYPIHADRVA